MCPGDYESQLKRQPIYLVTLLGQVGTDVVLTRYRPGKSVRTTELFRHFSVFSEWAGTTIQGHAPLTTNQSTNYMVLRYHCNRKHRRVHLGGARRWMEPGLPVQALGGGSVESGASQQSHSLIPVERVESTGSRVRGQKSKVRDYPGLRLWLFSAAAEGASRCGSRLLLLSSAPFSPSLSLSLFPHSPSPHVPCLLTCVGGVGWASETSSWPSQSESCDWTSPGQALRGWSCGSPAHCGGSLDKK